MNSPSPTSTSPPKTKYFVSVTLNWMVDTPSIEEACRTLHKLLGVEAKVLGEVVGQHADRYGNVTTYDVALRGRGGGTITMSALEAGCHMPINTEARATRYVVLLRYATTRTAASRDEAAALVRTKVPQWNVSTIGELVDERISPTTGLRELRVLTYTNNKVAVLMSEHKAGTRVRSDDTRPPI